MKEVSLRAVLAVCAFVRGFGLTVLVLVSALAVAIGPEIAKYASWGELLAPGAFGPMAAVAGGVILAWLDRSPLG
jgi:ApbE superfamily uncharacterized protein (UPF0280 family)